MLMRLFALPLLLNNRMLWVGVAVFRAVFSAVLVDTPPNRAGRRVLELDERVSYELGQSTGLASMISVGKGLSPLCTMCVLSSPKTIHRYHPGKNARAPMWK
jgi:hypothetical protein